MKDMEKRHTADIEINQALRAEKDAKKAEKKFEGKRRDSKLTLSRALSDSDVDPKHGLYKLLASMPGTAMRLFQSLILCLVVLATSWPNGVYWRESCKGLAIV